MTTYGQENVMNQDVEQALKADDGPMQLGAALKAPGPGATDKDPLIEKPKMRRYLYLDATRIAAVICVAVDHGAPQYGQWNAVFTQNWVLQLLFTVSGVSFAMSRQDLSGYTARLFWYFCLGVMINMTAWTLAGKDWKTNFFGMVFQFWFVAGLLIYSLLLHPMKTYLQKVRSRAISTFGTDDEDMIFHLPCDTTPATASRSEPEMAADRERAVTAEPAAEPEADSEVVQTSEDSYTAFFKAMALTSIALASVWILMWAVVEPLCQVYVTPGLSHLMQWLDRGQSGSAWMGYWLKNGAQVNDMVHGICSYMQCSICSVCIILIFPRLYDRTSLLGWLVLANMFLHRVILPRGKDERIFHGFDIFLLGFVVAHLGLRHRLKVATVIVRYWFVWLIACGMIWRPGTSQRLDCEPPSDALGRLRVNTLDAFFIVAWLTAGEYLFDDRIFTKDKLAFLNWWALAVFLLHKAIHILFPFPANWAILVSLIPACYLFAQRQK
jgi:hypothetical protein